MSHLLVSPPASMHRFVLLLFIFGLAQSIYAASFQFPDLTRRIPERPTSPGCAYKGVRYEHAERVPTSEPCLNCTCIRAVLVCYLRVCPTASAPPPGCFAAREVGECCPTLICGGLDLSRPKNKSDSSVDLRPTFQPSYESTSDDISTINDYSTGKTSSVYISDDSTEFSEDDITTFDEDGAIKVDQKGTTNVEFNTDYTATSDKDYSETAQHYDISPTGTYSTVSDTLSSKDDSLVFITSTGESTPDYDMNLYNDIPAGGCMVNGTLYGDGSAMLSSTFCEYCFCIRGKSTCLKPKCHLTIDGCVPHYDNHYTCCPSRYECTQKSSSVEIDDTTTLTSTVTGTTEQLDDITDCIIDGKIYHQGALIPDHKSCHNCYCKDSSVVCEKIKCSPPLEGCTPIIPQGYCCPISYRCDYEKGHVSSNSIKGSNLNDSTISADGKGTDIKSVKNFYIYDNENIRVKAPTDRESISLIHNIVPIQRRLDEISHSEQNSTVKSIDNGTVIEIGHGIPSNSNKTIDQTMDLIRENDKTLKLELNDTASALYTLEERTFEGAKPLTLNSRDEPSSVETVTLGSPVVHTLSIQELFDQFFGRKKPNVSKVPTETFLEPKRNNSKQPSSIVDIYELDEDIPESTTIKTSTTNVQTTGKESKITNEDLSTETGDIETHSFISNDSVLANDSFSDNTDREKTEIPEMTLNQGKIKNEDFSLLFSTTENGNTRDFPIRTGTETTHPVFLSTSKKDSEEDQSETDTYAEVKAVTARENFDSQDSMETSSSDIYRTIDDLLNLKSDSIPQTHPVFPTTNSRGTYNDNSKQTQSSPPDYSATKAALIEELKSYTQTRPVVFIYDMTKHVPTEKATVHKVTQSIPSLHDITTSSFSDKQKDYSDSQSETLFGGTTKILISDDSTDQSDMSEISSTEENLYNVLKNHGNILSVSPVHITTRNQNNDGIAETHQPNIHIFDTTRNINYEDGIRTSPSPLFSTEQENNYEQTETLPSSMQTSLENNNNNDQTSFKSPSSDTSTINQYSIDKKQTLKPFTPTTKTNFENEDHLIDRNTYSRPIFSTDTTKNINSENFRKRTEIPNTSPSLANTKYYQEETQGQTLITDRNTEMLTTVSGDERLSKTEIYAATKAKLPTTKTEDEDYSVDIVSHTPEISTPKDTSTTQTSRVSTRINSKLPSFSYVETVDQKNSNGSYSNYPVLTDSFINAYLSTQGKDNFSGNEKENFTNIGSIYLGAPLAVGGTDSRKDIDDQKPKITHSGGVIFLDPKFTDIDTKTYFDSKKSTQKDTISANREEQRFGDKTDKDLSNNERKKGPRNQDQSKSDQGFKIIPFVAEDAVRGQFGKINDSLVVQPGVTEGLPDIVSDFCFIKGRIYMNGEMIGKPDPCELCRCFYGRELCQIQRCPTPPPNCVPDKVPGFCCPRYTCGNNGTERNDEMKLVGIVLPSEVSTSTTRKPDIIDQKPSTNHKQEMKFGIRVRVRPSPIPVVRTSEYTTETKKIVEKTTVKPEIHTIFSKPSTAKAITTTSKPVITSRIPETKRTTAATRAAARTTTTTTTTPPSPLFPDPWGLLKVSGCNIYGKFFNINDQVEILSGPCSHCICTTNGVECNDIC